MKYKKNELLQKLFDLKHKKQNEEIIKSQEKYYLKYKNEQINVDPKKYVVLDVETNGLSSHRHDLLSICIFKPDDNKKYIKFLPLDLNDDIFTTKINGIKKSDLKNATHLTQEEFDEIIINFELQKRTILHYGNLDCKFIKNYLKRKNIQGFDKLNFFNFKKNIISSSFTEVDLSKDNICKAFKIKGIKKVHSGINDCILEWELFCKLNNRKIFVNKNVLFWYSSDYITPVSYLTTHPNFKHHILVPKLKLDWKKVKTFELPKISRHSNNIPGISIEYLIYHSLNLNNKINRKDLEFLVTNKSKLIEIFKMESKVYEIPIFFEDGIIKTFSKSEIDKKLIDEVNENNKILKNHENFKNVINYIVNNIFKKKKLVSQELVINKKDSVLALCDLSSENCVLEIKTTSPIIDEKKYFEKLKYQLYYQSNNRNTNLMTIEFYMDKIEINFWNITINIET